MLLGPILALSQLALAGEAAEVAAPEAQPDFQQMLGSAMKTIQEGNPGKAITEFLDPIIASFEPRAAEGQGRVFSANSMAETIYYAALGAGLDKAKGKAAGGDTVVLDGTWSSALHLKGYALIDQERYDEARAVLKRGTEIAPLHSLMWSELGAIYQLEKNWPEALAAYQQAEKGAELAFTGEDKQVNVLLTRALRGQGFVLIETGELGKAEKLYRRCLQLDPNDAGAKHELKYIDDMKRSKKK
jgi:tetratricopeptide (TPR) repeat protein